MKRRMDLVLAILEWLAEQPRTWAVIPEEMAGYDQEVVAYHVELCKQAGFINGDSLETSGYTRLSWAGHERLREIKAVVEDYC